MPNRLDHFMYAGADLDKLISTFESLSGLTASRGGSHPGMGTRNALASLGADVYLELIAPDPKQQLARTLGDLFRTFGRPRIFAYMIRAQDLERLKGLMAKAGIESELIEASRNMPSGTTLTWRLLLPRANPFGEHMPKFIDWMGTTHPATSSVKGCELAAFEIGHPEAGRLGTILGALDVDVPLVRADRPCFRAQLRTPKGPLALTGN